MAKHQYTKTITIFLALLAIVGILSYLFHHLNSRSTSGVPANETKSLFSFIGTPDWRQGPTNETSMALFSKARSDGTSACFTSAEFKNGIVDTTAEMADLQKNLDTTGGHTALLSVIPSVLHTNQGDKPYQLREHEIDSGNGSKDAMKGLAVGYVQLKDSYIKLSGHCETSDQLSLIAPALQSYKVEL